MNLKNYLLEYVSSGRRKLISGNPVEPDTVLKFGDVVRVKDRDWFDSLEKDHNGCGIVSGSVKNKDLVVFTEGMTKYLGKTIIIRQVYQKNGARKVTLYGADLYEEGERQNEIGYVFTNEMLEYI